MPNISSGYSSLNQHFTLVWLRSHSVCSEEHQCLSPLPWLFFLSLAQVGSVMKQICHLAYAILQLNITYYVRIVVALPVLEGMI